MNMKPEQSPFHADRSLFEAVANLGSPVACPEDMVLFRQGEECPGLFVLKSGRTTLQMNCESGEVCSEFEAEGGSLLGLPAILSGEKYSLTAVALRAADVGFVKRDDFLDLINSSSALSLKALQVMAAETRAARAALMEALERRRVLKQICDGSMESEG